MVVSGWRIHWLQVQKKANDQVMNPGQIFFCQVSAPSNQSLSAEKLSLEELMKQSETHIIGLLRDRNPQAMEVLYDQYGATLFGIILKIVQSKEAAEDVLQEAFTKIWLHSTSYSAQKGSLFTWMLNIARNAAIDKIRSAGYQKRGRVTDLDSAVGAEANHPQAEMAIDHIGVAQVVDGLDEKYRTLIELIYFQGFTQEEATKALGLPLGTVKSRLRLALRELRRIFGVPLATTGWLLIGWSLLPMLLQNAGVSKVFELFG